jgi:hypothetical protein
VRELLSRRDRQVDLVDVHVGLDRNGLRQITSLGRGVGGGLVGSNLRTTRHRLRMVCSTIKAGSSKC